MFGALFENCLKFKFQIRPDRFGATFGLEDMSMVTDTKSVLRPNQANDSSILDYGHPAFPGQGGHVTPKRKAGVPRSAAQTLQRSQSLNEQSTNWGGGWCGGILR